MIELIRCSIFASTSMPVPSLQWQKKNSKEKFLQRTYKKEKVYGSSVCQVFDKWADRLRTEEEKLAMESEAKKDLQSLAGLDIGSDDRGTGTIVGN